MEGSCPSEGQVLEVRTKRISGQNCPNEVRPTICCFRHRVTGAVDHVCVVVGAPSHGIVSGAAIQKVIPGSSDQAIVAGPALKGVIPAPAVEGVIAVEAPESVVAPLSRQSIALRLTQ